MKILPKITNTAEKTCIKAGKNIKRYMLKTTVSGKYERHMDGAAWFGAAAFLHAIQSGFDPIITTGLFGVAYGNAIAALVNRFQLRPIKKKAKAIKKAVKLAKKNAERLKKEQTQNPENRLIKNTLNKPKLLLQSIKNKLLRSDKK